jgi:3-deoxy-D-manno-octulosonic acid kinase
LLQINRAVRSSEMKSLIPGYSRARIGRTTLVVADRCAMDLRPVLEAGTLYTYAAARPDARTLQGRGPAFAVALPGACGRAVVRHARRGGWLARFNKDRFVSRLRPLRELIASMRLRLLGVPTPEFVAYAMYPSGLFFRYDVATREVEHGADLAAWLQRTGDSLSRLALIEATAVLLDRLSEAGAHHADLNAKNVLLVPRASGYEGIVLDVDRVQFHVSRSPMVKAANLERLQHSLRKLSQTGVTVAESEITTLAERVQALHQERIALDRQ